VCVLLLLSRVASAGEICGDVDIAGRPLPRGFVRLSPDPKPWSGPDEFGRDLPSPGPVARGLLRLRDGAFCIKDVPPGNYALAISPLNFTEPLAVVLDKTPLLPGAVRLTVNRAGVAEARDGRGRLIRAGRLRLSADGRDEPGGTRVDGEVRFQNEGASPPAANTALVVAYFRESITSGRYSFQWLHGRPRDGKVRFELFGVKGELMKLDLAGRGWAKRSDFWRFKTDAKDRIDAVIEAGRAAPFSGTFRTEEGAPYRAAGAEDLFAAVLVGFSGQWGLRTPVDEDGRFELDAVPGRYEVDTLGRTETHKTGRPTFFLWISSAGATADVVLKDVEAGARVNTARLGVEVVNGGHDFVVAYPSGQNRVLSPCELETVDLYLALDSEGRWVREVPYSWGGEADVAWVRPGTYDFFVVRIKDDPWPSLRVIGAASQVELKGGRVTEVSIPGPAYPTGGAILSGNVQPVADADYAGLKQAADWSALCPRAFPTAAVYDSHGRFVASFAAGISQGDPRSFKEAVWRNDVGGMEATFTHPRTFRLGGLPPGSYRVRMSRPSRPVWEASVDLRQDEETVLNIDPNRLPAAR